ncbi:helix-turn-helix domain-containing GNAT family N-acetyltransferase [Paracoccus laeviglucosivorans]|uniref:Transcriptional regulator, MarR family with acetyltransferase activity n=1 Tax=Paracoccus laeviglucosivorans TaxID=1197861 RepID=A0A521F265_9RHOB|nr:helix-turn-helix domain-containing GNAT family N-acetyltransferase [Paracoccus laeviglucosivorans]SMO90282.1 transcriptional regulator, MarR family with acetyltransferase activity [Paracoccus laeviglucosivorans]
MTMPVSSNTTISAIRSASRALVRELGFMNGSIAGTTLPPSSVHALIEVEGGSATAADLAARLRLDKSSVSRMLRKLVDAGLIEERPNPADGRAKILALTPSGKVSVAGIHDFAQRQVSDAIARLPVHQTGVVLQGLALYADALGGRSRTDERPQLSLVQGYQPGLIARITQLHIDFYAREHGFGQLFESRVAAGLAEFSNRLDRDCNRVWTVVHDGVISGSIAIDGEDLGGGKAHLRWFVVDQALHGAGAGRQLLAAAMAFVDGYGFAETHLDTFAGLDAARRLYERAGFALADEVVGAQWGTKVREQRFVRPAGRAT